MKTKIVYRSKDDSRLIFGGNKLILASRISHFVNYPWVMQEILGYRRGKL